MRLDTPTHFYRLLLCACSLLLLPPALLAQAPPDAAGKPRIFCAEPTHNFGTASDQDTVTHTFLIENRGNADLRLLNVRTTCDCTTAEFSRDTIPPGEGAELKTAFVLRGRTGDEVKKAYVRTNDPENPTMGFTLEGKVQRTFSLDPQKIVFRPRTRDTDEGWHATVHLAIQHDTPWKVTRLETTDPAFFSATVHKQDDHAAEIEVTLDKDYFIAEGSARGGLTIHTSHPNYQSLFVAIRAAAPQVLQITPSRLAAESRRGGPPSSEQTLFVKSQLADALEVIEVEVPEGLKAKVQVLRHYVIHIDGFAENSAELSGKEVRIKALVEGTERVFTIPVLGNDD